LLNLNNNFIDGELKKSFSGSFTLKSSFFDYNLELPNSSIIELNLAISCANKARDSVKKLDFEERCTILKKAAELYEVSDEELDHLVKMTGMPKKYVKERCGFGKIILNSIPNIVKNRYGHLFGEITKKIKGNDILKGYETHRPVDGIISAFVPPNDPAEVPFLLGHIVMYGGISIIKPSSQEPYFSLKIAELLTKAGYPKGALNVIQWNTSDESRKVVSLELVRKSNYRIIMGGKATADILLKTYDENEVLIEENYSTGSNCIFSSGNSKAIVDEGCDVDQVSEMLIKGAYEWTRDCVTTKSVYVVNTLKDALIERIKEKLTKKSEKIGNPLYMDTEIGYSEDADKIISNISGLVEFKYVKMHFGELKQENNLFKPFLIETTNLNCPLLHNENPYTLTIVPVSSFEEGIENINKTSELLTDGMTMSVAVFSKYNSIKDMFAAEPKKVRKMLNMKTHMLMFNRPSLALNIYLRHQDQLMTEFLTKPMSINHE